MNLKDIVLLVLLALSLALSAFFAGSENALV